MPLIKHVGSSNEVDILYTFRFYLYFSILHLPMIDIDGASLFERKKKSYDLDSQVFHMFYSS